MIRFVVKLLGSGHSVSIYAESISVSEGFIRFLDRDGVPFVYFDTDAVDNIRQGDALVWQCEAETMGK